MQKDLPPNPVFRGRVASYEPTLAPSEYARRGRRLRYEADWALRRGHRKQAETLYRGSVESLVDAFLFDRRGHEGCFREAHVLGRRIQETFQCPLGSDDGGANWGRDCGVLALHQRLGLSFGGPTRGRCSVCSAEDFTCMHVPGQFYGGRRCVRVVYEVDLQEISLVPVPEDPRCYRLRLLHSRAEVEGAFGGPLPRGATPMCTHCTDCDATEFGAHEEDIDQTLWPVIAP